METKEKFHKEVAQNKSLQTFKAMQENYKENYNMIMVVSFSEHTMRYPILLLYIIQLCQHRYLKTLLQA